MELERIVDQTVVHKYETAFCVFMAALAYLWRDNPEIVYPQVLYLFLLLLTLNLAAGLSLRLRPAWKSLSAAFILGNCGVITAILDYSGGSESNLWVLHLLPIFSACLLLDLREVFWITAGAIGFNAALTICEAHAWTETPVFALFVKSAIFILTAAIACRMAQRDRVTRWKLEKKRAELQRVGHLLQRQHERVVDSDKLADVGLLSSGAIHGLNNTFTALLGFIHIALETDASPELHDNLEGARLCALRGRDMLSTFSALMRRRRRPFGPCDTRGLLEASLPQVRIVLAQKRARLSVSMAQELPLVLGDRVHLERLFRDLIHCAAELAGPGEELALRAAATRAQSHRFELVVETSGRRIPEETLQDLFEPLAENENRGLYLCAEIAIQHKGFVQAQARREGGVRFILTLPARENPSRAAASAGNEAMTALRSTGGGIAEEAS